MEILNGISENGENKQQRFVDMNNGDNGLHEYQVTDDDEITIALTLLPTYEINRRKLFLCK